MADSLLLRFLIPVAAALIASWVSLLYRYRRAGQPFGSWRAAAWSVAVIGLTTIAAAAVGLLVWKIDPVTPIAVGVLLPALLCADKFGQPESPVEHSVWYKLFSVGVLLLLDQLEQQIDSDRDKWVRARMTPGGSMISLEKRIEDVYDTLKGRVSDHRRVSQLNVSHDMALQAIVKASKGAQTAKRRARSTAEKQLMVMLACAWNWGYMDISA